MKKVFLFAAVLGATTLTSCKKDYTCTCDVFGTDYVVEYNDVKSSDAETLEASCETSSLCEWAEK